jgi:hypothetical protein
MKTMAIILCMITDATHSPDYLERIVGWEMNI